MNKRSSIWIIATIVMSSLFIIMACKEPEPPVCCTGMSIVERDYDTLGYKGHIKVYTAFTPKNKHYCDSLVWDFNSKAWRFPYDANNNPIAGINNIDKLCTPEQALEKFNNGCKGCCPCRTNPDTVHNLSEAGESFNDFFIVDGIESFPYNSIFVRVPGDTSKVKVFSNYNNIDLAFDGQLTVDSTLFGRSPITKMARSGKYEYELILFADSMKAISIDTIHGAFCIVRTPDDENEGCKAKEEGDQLIK
ncbi:MAG: hypothetical protein IPO21_07410 [Bacteroidales bacterium]|nr:hypothetical protein [Bacteroidales bacterium]